MKKYVDKINLLLIFLVVGYVPLFIVLYSIFPNTKISVPITIYNLFYLMIPFELIIYIYNIFKKKIKIGKYDIFIYILMFLGIITTIFAVDTFTSLWGSYSRNSGLLSMLTFYLLFLNSKDMDKKYIDAIVNFLFVVGIFQFVYCLLQVFVRGEAVITFSLEGINYMATGFTGNPNFLGSYCILLLGLSLMYYFMYNNKRYFWLSIIFYINLILAQSTGPFFALIGLFIFMIIFMIIKKVIDWKKVIIVFITFVLTFLLVSNGVEIYCKKVFNDKIVSSYTIKGDILSTFKLFNKNKSDEENIQLEKYGSKRFIIWKNTLAVVPDHFLLGIGFDNLGRVYKSDGKIRAVIDKAHNEYLEILVTQGIFALVTYLLLFLNLFVDGIKSKNKTSWILLMSFIGYAAQAFLNISIITVAPIFYIIIGMLAASINHEKKV